MTDWAFSKCRVLDLTDDKGAFCGRILGDLGADVVKIEPPEGDPSRKIGPFYKKATPPENSLYWYNLNASKRGITLNLKKKEGRELFKALVKTANIVIESFKIGYMKRIGLGYNSLTKIKPDIIMTSVSPYGQDGPYSAYPTSDIVAQAMSGFMFMIGDPGLPPLRISVPQAYLHAGGQASVATLIAYYYWENTGEGQYIDACVHGGMTGTTFNAAGFWDLRKQILQRSGPYRQGMSTTSQQLELWKCKDGFVAFILLGGGTGAKTNQRLVEWMAEENMAPPHLLSMDWNKFDQASASAEYIASIDQPISEFFMAHTMAELDAGAVERKIMLTSVSTPKEIVEFPQLKARDFWQTIERPGWKDSFKFPGPPLKFSEGYYGWRRHAPLLGEHNREIYAHELGLSPSRLSALKEAQVI